MPHVFDYEKNKFVQVHAKKVDQRPMTAIIKRQKNSEYMKFLLKLEKEDNERRAAHESKSDD
eukprot:CAMPEP_0117512002 /NCGR_PEP_ID=MMETSP0784-20121206/28804_1 /TAXON_ID=39447 /ORGANISM="" /LENGTH=61 /DNA_ID=CAMNT_0005307703 /DNA_START=92 /DNA_END=277 /DNA_ORIENTATION=-